MAFCEQCGNKLNEGTKFCGKCGTAVSIEQVNEQNTNASVSTECVECGTELEDGAAFCGNCGAKVSAGSFAQVQNIPTQTQEQHLSNEILKEGKVFEKRLIKEIEGNMILYRHRLEWHGEKIIVIPFERLHLCTIENNFFIGIYEKKVKEKETVPILFCSSDPDNEDFNPKTITLDNMNSIRQRIFQENTVWINAINSAFEAWKTNKN